VDKSIKNVRRPFPLYKVCQELYELVTATGSHATAIQEVADSPFHAFSSLELESLVDPGDVSGSDEKMTPPTPSASRLSLKAKAPAVGKSAKSGKTKLNKHAIDSLTIQAINRILEATPVTPAPNEHAKTDADRIIEWAEDNESMGVESIVALMLHLRDHPADASLALATKDNEARKRFLSAVAGLF
jgi:hypothetical protein